MRATFSPSDDRGVCRRATSWGAVRLVEMPRFIPTWLQRPAAAALLAGLRPDVVHTHLNPAARRIGAVAQRFRIPHVLTLHLDYDRREHAAIDGLIALSAAQREQIPSDFAGEVAMIWNWLPSSVAASLERIGPADVTHLRAGWDADNSTVVFGSVGRLMPEKGTDTLIRAFNGAFAAGSEPVRLVIVGDGGQRDELERLAGNDRRIVFVGVQAEIAPFYRAFDVFVNAARFEPFGLAIIEAMAAGCRLIATRIHGTVEFATDSRVLWAAPGHDDELGTQLLCAAALKRERYGYDMSRLTLARAGQQIEAFYRRVASRR